MRPDERRRQIMDLVRQHGRVIVDELAGLLDVSRESIRRDLNVLSTRGLVRKFHGGAEYPRADGENAYRVRMTENVQAKRQIARRAAALFSQGDTLFVDPGTTTEYFSEELAKVAGVSVITNSSAIALNLSGAGVDNQVYMIGGQFHSDRAASYGALAVEQIRLFHASDAVLAVGAINANAGITNYLIEEAEVGRAMSSRARRVTVLADSSKVGKTALFEVCPLEHIDRLVTERRPEGGFAAALSKAGIEVLVASG
jgi:DeoR family glycerol-3-phosphate regulon repressor